MKNIVSKIENQFEQLGYFVFAQRWKVILMALVLFGVLASQVPHIVIDTSNEAFLEPDDPILTQYDAFRDQFGRDEVVVVAIQPKDVFERQFLERLKAFHDDLESEVPYLDEVISLVNVTSIKGEEEELLVEELLEDWPEDEEGIAALKKDVLSNKFYKNLLISEDGTFTTVIIRSNAFTGEDTLTEDSEFGEDMFEDEGGSDSAENSEVTTLDETPEGRITEQQNTEFTAAIESIVRRYTTPDFPTNVAGSPVMTGVLKDEMMSNIPRFTLMALGLIGILLLLLFRTPVGVFLPLLTVIMSLISAIGLMAVSGTPLTVVTQILPSLLLAVGVGYSVHLLTIYYHHLQRNGDKEKAIVFALGHSGLAILMTSLTTAGGLISFLPAPLAPVSALGLFGAIGVLLAVFYTLLFVPAVLAVLPVSKKRVSPEDDGSSLADRILGGFGMFAVNRPWTVVFGSILLGLVAVGGTTQLRFSHDVISWFPEDNSIRQATEVIDKNLKGATSIEIIIDTGKINGVKDPDFMQRLDDFNRFAEQWKSEDPSTDVNLLVGKSTSIADTLKQIHQALNENQEEFYVVPEDRDLIGQELILFENSGSDDLENVVDSQFSQARITVKTSWADAGSYTEMIRQLEEKANELFGDAKEIIVTGLVPLLTRTIDLVMLSMVISYSAAAVIITLMMILLLTDWRLGLWSMIPNFLPILMGLGVMGALDLPLDMASMLVGSIALGLAVDDTVHFLHNFRRYFHDSRNVSEAVSNTLHTAGRAMLFTTVALSIGFFVYTQATLKNLYSFGLITGFTIIMALLADLLLAPAMMTLIYRNKTTDN